MVLSHNLSYHFGEVGVKMKTERENGNSGCKDGKKSSSPSLLRHMLGLMIISMLQIVLSLLSGAAGIGHPVASFESDMG